MPPPVYFTIRPHNLECLTNRRNSLVLIQKCIDDWELSVNAIDEYELLFSGERICHGIISSLTLLRIIDRMYRDRNPHELEEDIYCQGDNGNWNQRNFNSFVVPACAAIFIHNLPSDRFEHSKINPSVAPLPFLLRLSDNLQEWQRPSHDNLDGFDPSDFDIQIIGQKLVFTTRNTLLTERIREVISQSLVDDNIEIRTVSVFCGLMNL